MSGYQLMPALRAEEREALKADITKRGVMIPVEVDAASGEILDGHHRTAIATELGIPYPTVARTFATEEEKVEHVLKLNLARRHLEPFRWGAAFEQLLKVRGVQLGQGKRNDAASATVAEVAAELGVADRTARFRIRQWHQYEALPEKLRAAVDGGPTALAAAIGQHKRDELNTEAERRREKDAEQQLVHPKWVGRPGWHGYGLEAGAGPNIIPLEAMWPTPGRVLRRYVEGSRSALSGIERALPPQKPNESVRHVVPFPQFKDLESEVRAVAGAEVALGHLKEAIDNATALISAAIKAATPLLDAAARELEEVAGRAPRTRIPPGDDADSRAIFVKVNKRQVAAYLAGGGTRYWDNEP